MTDCQPPTYASPMPVTDEQRMLRDAMQYADRALCSEVASQTVADLPDLVFYRDPDPLGERCEDGATVTGTARVVSTSGHTVGTLVSPLTYCLDCHQITAPQEDTHP